VKPYALLLALLPLVGCESLSRLTGGPESKPAESAALPDDYTVTGVTVVDRQTIQPVRVVDSKIRVWVRKPGALEFRELNEYEFYPDPYGPGGGGVWLKGEILVQSGKQYPQGRPAAPTGSEYRIQSAKVRP
jgi:hypothetical protein